MYPIPPFFLVELQETKQTVHALITHCENCFHAQNTRYVMQEITIWRLCLTKFSPGVINVDFLMGRDDKKPQGNQRMT